MKRSVLILMVAAIALVALTACVPAYAAGPGVKAVGEIHWWHPATAFTVAGRVQAVDTANSRLVLRVWLASVGAQQYLGDDMTVVIKPGTVIVRKHNGTLTRTDLAHVKLNDHVRINGAIDRTVPVLPVYKAERVVVRTIQPPEALKWFAVRGPIKAVDAAGNTLVLHARLVTRGLFDVVGTDVTFKVAPDARIITWRDGVRVALTLDKVVAGDRALAQGSIDRSDPAAPVFTISWMKIWEPTPAPGS